jgi:hypothetical protein
MSGDAVELDRELACLDVALDLRASMLWRERAWIKR